MVDQCMRTDSSCCDPSRITLDLRSRVIRLGSQLEESFLTHLSTIRFLSSAAAGDYTYRTDCSIDLVARVAFHAYPNTMTNTSSDLEIVDVS